MSFDWSEYLTLAQELAGQGTKPSSREAKFRSAVSRAYYAAFGNARNYLHDTKGVEIPRDVDAHQFVWKLFVAGDKRHKKIGVNGHRLRVDRNRADYDDKIINLRSCTMMALRLATEIITTLASL